MHFLAPTEFFLLYISILTEAAVSEYFDRRNVMLGLLLKVDQNAVHMRGTVVQIVIKFRIVEQQTERRICRVELLGSAVEIGCYIIDIAHCRVKRHCLEIL